MKPRGARLRQLGLLSGTNWETATRIVCTVRRMTGGKYDSAQLRSLCDGAILGGVVHSSIAFYRVIVTAEQLGLSEVFMTPARLRRKRKDRHL